MRKFVFVLVIIFSLIFASCGTGSNEFEKALNNMNETQSFRVDIKMENVPIFGTVVGYKLFDNEYRYTSFLGDENYTLVSNDKEYNIVEFLDEKYAYETIEQNDASSFDVRVYDEFTSENFSKSNDGYYISDVNYDRMSNVKVKIDNGYFREVTAKIDSKGYVFNVTLEFSGFNSTSINFPDFEYMDDFKSVLYVITEEEELTYSETSTGFILSDWNDTISYQNDSDFFLIEDWPTDLYFYPEKQEIVKGNNTFTISEYFYNESYPPFEENVLELLTRLYYAKK
jgi:hypothetical protein